MKINEVLRPCPFCGSEVEVASLRCDQIGPTQIQVRCRCGAEVEIYSDDRIYSNDVPHQLGQTAIDKWNRRVSDEG